MPRLSFTRDTSLQQNMKKQQHDYFAQDVSNTHSCRDNIQSSWMMPLVDEETDEGGQVLTYRPFTLHDTQLIKKIARH